MIKVDIQKVDAARVEIDTPSSILLRLVIPDHVEVPKGASRNIWYKATFDGFTLLSDQEADEFEVIYQRERELPTS